MPAQCCYDFFNKIPKDEPVFTLVAHDLFALELVASWIKRAERYNINPDKIRRAQLHLDDMIQWRNNNPDKVKLPD